MTQKTLDSSAQRVADSRKKFQEMHCRGRARDDGDVLESLKRLRSAHDNLRWLPEAYRQSSQVLQGRAFDWLIGRDESGARQWKLPSLEQRIGWLNHLVITFYGVGDAALQVVGLQDERAGFEAGVMQLLGAKVFDLLPD